MYATNCLSLIELKRSTSPFAALIETFGEQTRVRQVGSII